MGRDGRERLQKSMREIFGVMDMVSILSSTGIMNIYICVYMIHIYIFIYIYLYI